MSTANRDATLFSVCFAVGIILLLVLRLPFLLNQSAILTALLLCAIIIIYAFVVWRQGSARLSRNDRAADNLYYLGFIFTVCALGVSLYRFSVSENAPISDIVGDLGVGLSTTIVGLFLRVLILQHEDLEEIENEVRSSLIELAEATISNIRQTAEIVEQGQIHTRQTINELNDTTNQFSSGLTTRMRELEQQLQEVEIPSDVVSSRLNPALDDVSQSIVELATKIDHLEVPSHFLTERLEHSFSNLGESLPILLDNTAQSILGAISSSLVSLRTQAEEAVKVIEQVMATRVAEISLPTDEFSLQISNTLDRLDENSKFLITGMQHVKATAVQAEQLMLDSQVKFSNTLEPFGTRIAELFGDVEMHVNSLGSKLVALDTDKLAQSVSMLETFVQESKETIDAQRTLTSEQSGRIEELSSQLLAINTSVPKILESLGTLNINLSKVSVVAKESQQSVSQGWKERIFGSN